MISWTYHGHGKPAFFWKVVRIEHLALELLLFPLFLLHTSLSIRPVNWKKIIWGWILGLRWEKGGCRLTRKIFLFDKLSGMDYTWRGDVEFSKMLCHQFFPFLISKFQKNIWKYDILHIFKLNIESLNLYDLRLQSHTHKYDLNDFEIMVIIYKVAIYLY